MKKELVNEIFYIRAIACLGIVMLHSITATISNYEGINDKSFYHYISLLLLVCTPLFVFISEFLLAKSSVNKKRNIKEFFIIRFKYLLIPYAVMGIVYAVIRADEFNLTNIIIESAKNVFLADYTGYFILIIFQFYILHFFFERYLKNISPKKVIIFSFLFNVIYLAFFNLIPPFGPEPFASYLWYRVNWMLFTGWIFYFVIGYYAGKHFSTFQKLLEKYKVIIVSSLVASIILLFGMYQYNIIEEFSSKRFDIVIYATFIIATSFYTLKNVKTVPKIILLISNYSFNIYLLHKIFIEYFETIQFGSPILNIIILFLLAVSLSIILSYLVNKFTIGKYMIGNTMKFKI